MADWSQLHNNTMNCPLTPTLRVSWSKVRCWHGDIVTISIRSSYVIDGGIVDLEIFPLQQAAAIDTIQNLAINGNMLDHQYTINWTNLNIPPGSIQFKVVATLRVPHTVSAPSDPLSVDLIAPLFSA